MVLFAMTVLSVSIGAATAVFSLTNAVVLRALPFHEPSRLVWMCNARLERDRAPFAVLDLDDYGARNHVLERFAGFMNWTANLTGVGEPERLEGMRVATAFFDVLGSDAAYGRVFRTGEDAEQRIAVITDRLWRRRFGGDRGIVGRNIELSGVPYTVVGVLPQSFVFPFRDADVAVPLSLTSDPRRTQRSWGLLRVVARLKPGVSVEGAKRDLDAIGHQLQKEHPVEDGKRTGVNLYPLQQEIVGDARQFLTTLMVAVVFVLCLAAANVGNLIVVWLSDRRAEFSVATALGASRARLVAQIALEAGALVVGSGVVALWLASLMIQALVWWVGTSVPRIADARLDAVSVAFACTATFFAIVICVVVPAWHATSRVEGIEQQRASTLSPDRQRLRRILLGAQVAISVSLVMAIGLTVRSLINLQRVDVGFRPAHSVLVQLSLPPARYRSVGALNQLADALSPRFQSIPGTRSVAAISLAPLSGLLRAEDFRIVGRPDPRADEVPQAHYRVVTPRYFATIGIPLREGREFTEDDRATTQRVAIVSTALARQFWPGASVLGVHLRMGTGDEVEIVGVAADVKQLTLDAAPTTDVYVPLRQAPESEASGIASRMYWVISTSTDRARIADAVRREISAVDADIASSGVRSMQGVVDDSLAPRRFNAIVLALFGQVAIVLAAAGVYGITAFSVQRRRREIGVRIALGAQRRDIMGMVFASEWRALGAGLLCGAGGGLVASRLLSSSLFRVDGVDTTTWLSTVAAVAAMAAIGCYLPARRAAIVDPAMTLR
jgi:putative ABC transport system permease protein